MKRDRLWFWIPFCIVSITICCALFSAAQQIVVCGAGSFSFVSNPPTAER